MYAVHARGLIYLQRHKTGTPLYAYRKQGLIALAVDRAVMLSRHHLTGVLFHLAAPHQACSRCPS